MYNMAEVGQDIAPVVESSSSFVGGGSNSHEGTVASDIERERKRYRELQSYSSKQNNAKQEEIDRLNRELQRVSTSEKSSVPKTPEEVQEWYNKYPDVAATVETIAETKASKVREEVSREIERLSKREQEVAKKESYSSLRSLHPDVDELKASDAFHAWVEEQPPVIQDALYRSPNDYMSASRAIDLYKADKAKEEGRAKGSSSNRASANISRNEAAKAIGNSLGSSMMSQAGSPSETNWEYTAEQVVNMSLDEYEKHKDKIYEAVRRGKYRYDPRNNSFESEEL